MRAQGPEEYLCDDDRRRDCLIFKPGMEVHAYDPSTAEQPETRGSLQVQGQPG